MRRGLLPLLPILLTTLALTGCGGSGDGVPVAAVEPVPAPAAGVTDGRTGDAVALGDRGPLRSLSTGGRPDPSRPAPGGARRDGVAAGDACAEVELAPAPGTLDRVEEATLCLLNGERADRGLPALVRNARLARAAGGHAADMVAGSYFAHEGRDGSNVRDRVGATGYIPSSGRWVIGENLAWGTGPLATPKSIVNAWMNSAGHRANILHADYREIGFGIVVGNPREANGVGATYATEFGVTGNADAVTPEADEPGTTPRRASRSTARRRAATKVRRARRARQSRARQARQSRTRAQASTASAGSLTGSVAGSAAGR